MFSEGQFDQWMNNKQSIMGQEAAAQMAHANAALLGAQGQAGLAAAQGTHIGALTPFEQQFMGAQARETQERARAAQSQTDLLNSPFNIDADFLHPNAYATGTAKVPGQGDPRVDSVAAKLAPDEAVLNAGAADMVGRGLIDVLNAIGQLRMGMPAPMAQRAQGMPQAPAVAPPGAVPGFARGTSRVASKAGPAPKGVPKGKDDGAGAAALMTFLRGMGAPQGNPGGAPPMPTAPPSLG